MGGIDSNHSVQVRRMRTLQFGPHKSARAWLKRDLDSRDVEDDHKNLEVTTLR